MRIIRLGTMMLASLIAAKAFAQLPADTLRLSDLQSAAQRQDPRAVEAALLAQQSRLRAATIAADRRPAITAEGVAQYQSDVTRLGLSIPGASLPTPPHDTYDARLIAQQRLTDPTRAPRLAVESAQLVALQAQVATSLYALRQNVNDAYFTALRAQSQLAELSTSIADLEAQLQVASTRVREGAALPSEALTIRAELLRRGQVVAEASAARRAALVVLSDLTGIPIDTSRALGDPETSAAILDARIRLDAARGRPEFVQFEANRRVIEEQLRARAAADKPRLSAVGRIGYGRPGLNPLNTGFDAYWLAGLQAQWSPWTWGTSQRDRDVLSLQLKIVSADETAFAATLRRAVAGDLVSIDRLVAAIATDDEIIALREQVLTETRARYREGVITSAEYIDRQTDVLAARISRAQHRVELSQYRARFLTTLGVEVR
jgi:outer membrane protein TolC